MDPSATPSAAHDAEIQRRDAQQLRRGRIGVLGVTFFVVSAAAPLTAMAGGAPSAMLLGNGPGIPLAYVIVSVMLLIFSVGYTTMARHHTSSGAFYSYITRGLRQHTGGAAAFVALLGYNAMQIGLYGLFGVAMAGFVSTVGGPELPWWSYVLIAIVLIGVLGYRQVDLSMKVLGVLVALEFLVVVVLDLAIVAKGGQGGTAALTMEPFTPSALMSAGAGGLAIALLFNSASYIGFEATTIYSEEAKDPKRTVPRATYLAVITIGVFYTITTWLMVNAQGAATLSQHLAEMKPDPTGFLFELGAIYVGPTFTTVMLLLFATSLFAALLAFHNAVARYLYSLGREGLLPERVGHTHDLHLSPHIGSASQSVLALVVVALFVVTGQDPVLALFVWLTQLGTLAILFLMAICSAAVVAFFVRHPDLEPNKFASLVAPAIGAVTMTAVALFATSQFGLLIGNPESPLAWGLPALIAVAAVAGMISAGMLARRSPRMFTQMGRHRGDD